MNQRRVKLRTSCLRHIACCRCCGCRFEPPSYSDDDLASGVSFSQVVESVGDVAQVVAPIYYGYHLSGLEKPSQYRHVRLIELRDEEDDLPATTQCCQTYLG